MNCWFRYFLVGVLVSGMAVQPAAARRLFQRRCCPAACVETCPQVCAGSPEETGSPDIAPCGCHDISTVVDLPCVATDSVPTDTTCQNCAVESQPEIVTETIVAPSPVAPSPAPFEATESPSAPPSNPTALPPAPLAVPEMSGPQTSDVVAPTTPIPTPIELPDAGVVGDRYADETDLFDQPAPESSTPDAPVVPAAVVEGSDDLFGAPSAPAEEEGSSEDPAPQPELNEEDLFGPSESAEPVEPGVVEEEDEEESDKQPQDAESPATDESEESYDPFGEDLTGLESQSEVLTAAGGLQSNTERIWTDHTATYQCEARLLRVTAKNVVLLQSSGAKRVVPLARLANDDLHFVHQQITALRVVRARDTAAEKLAVSWAR